MSMNDKIYDTVRGQLGPRLLCNIETYIEQLVDSDGQVQATQRKHLSGSMVVLR